MLVRACQGVRKRKELTSFFLTAEAGRLLPSPNVGTDETLGSMTGTTGTMGGAALAASFAADLRGFGAAGAAGAFEVDANGTAGAPSA